jgi:hypothetical protein
MPETIQQDSERHHVEAERHHRRAEHHPLLGIVVDDRAQPDAEGGGEHQVQPGDGAGGEHRLGLEIDPEGDGEPHREIGDVGDEVVAQDLVERRHETSSAGPPGLTAYSDR